MKILKELDKLWQKKITRKDFLTKSAAFGLGAVTSLYLVELLTKYKAFAAIGEKRGMHEALFYKKMGSDAVKCMLCPNQCFLSNGQRGFCRVREPVKGKLYSLVYELVCSAHVDPIEKKPIFHVLPGSRSFSIATAGCNSRCKYCQNWTISQKTPEETINSRLTTGNLANSASKANCDSIAYTYTEPAVFYEYMIDSAKKAKEKNIYNIMVTGGKLNPEPVKMLTKHVEIANVDLKGFNNKYMNEVCAQDLDNILRTLTIMKQGGMWVEITNLIVPTLNDNMDDIRKMARWIKSNLGRDVPLHFSRFWPQYKLRSLYPTPAETIKRAREVALEEGLHYVYIGNLPGLGGENTICPNCKKVAIGRMGYKVLEVNISNEGICNYCGNKISGIWKKRV